MNQPIYKQTLSGQMLPIDNIQPEHINFEDMAVQLSRIMRYNGAALKNISVARHSLNVAKALWLEHDASWATVFYGLLHDGHEYIFGDIISPVKQLISRLYGSSVPLTRVVEKADRAIYTAAGLPDQMLFSQRQKVKLADQRMMATEKRDWLHVSAMPWLEDLPQPYPCRYACSLSEESDAAEFLQWIRTLQCRIHEEAFT